MLVDFNSMWTTELEAIMRYALGVMDHATSPALGAVLAWQDHDYDKNTDGYWEMVLKRASKALLLGGGTGDGMARSTFSLEVHNSI